MFFKKLKKSFLILLLTLSIMPNYVLAYSDYIIASGKNIGIELNTNGVMVVGLYKVDGDYPARSAGVEVGDTIIAINGKDVSNISEMVEYINEFTRNNTIDVTYKRLDKTYDTTLNVIKDENNVYKTGLYVKDGITGIGTLTFIDPNTKLFGALGHEIIEKTTGKILEIKDGKIYDSTVTSISPSANGNPGEKNASLDTNTTQGIIKENTTNGLFGTYTSKLNDNTLYKVAKPEDIKTGKAKIFTVINGNEVKDFDINITKISSSSQKTKNLLFEITDQELLDKTNGIVQGMSGSPIIQGEYIIGAVTHVVVDNPQKGYGIFITNMLKEAEN